MRIDAEMDYKQAIFEMSDGLIGAVTVLTRLVELDPNLLLTLDEMGLYGSDIWLAYKDVCGEDLRELIRKINDNTIDQAVKDLPYR